MILDKEEWTRLRSCVMLHLFQPAGQLVDIYDSAQDIVCFQCPEITREILSRHCCILFCPTGERMSFVILKGNEKCCCVSLLQQLAQKTRRLFSMWRRVEMGRKCVAWCVECRVRPPVSPGPALRCPAPGATGRSQLSVTVGPRTRPQPRDVTCRTCIVTLRDKSSQLFSWRDNLIVIQCIKNIEALSYLLFMENIYNPNS